MDATAVRGAAAVAPCPARRACSTARGQSERIAISAYTLLVLDAAVYGVLTGWNIDRIVLPGG